MDSRYRHALPARPTRSFSTHPLANRALPFLDRQVRAIATDGVEESGALPVGWTAREPWVGADRYRASGPANVVAPELPPEPAPGVEVVDDLTLRVVASLPVEAYAAPARRWASWFGINRGQSLRRFTVPVVVEDEPISFDFDSMHAA
ncbi:MAG: hypothetical protein R3B99_35935 [Polyangiales bacterium]|nr:hypothetical protein [Sandaracinus sp.]